MTNNKQLLFVCSAGDDFDLEACRLCKHHNTNIGNNHRYPNDNEPDIWLSGMSEDDCKDYIPIDEAENNGK